MTELVDRAARMRHPENGAGVSLVIFDCDGVLIDSEILVCDITGQELRRLGYQITLDEVIDRYAGRPEAAMIAEIELDWGRPVPESFFQAMRQRVEQAYATELRVMPGIVDLLGRLPVDFCVASSSYPAKLALGLRSVGLYDRFAPNIVSASFVHHGKPAPDIFVFASGWMHRAVQECLVIEDSVPGVRAAVSAGMRVIGFVGGRHCPPPHRERLLAAGAQSVIGSFDELDPLLLPAG